LGKDERHFFEFALAIQGKVEGALQFPRLRGSITVNISRHPGV
jgi:hypothetical protein